MKVKDIPAEKNRESEPRVFCLASSKDYPDGYVMTIAKTVLTHFNAGIDTHLIDRDAVTTIHFGLV